MMQPTFAGVFLHIIALKVTQDSNDIRQICICSHSGRQAVAQNITCVDLTTI